VKSPVPFTFGRVALVGAVLGLVLLVAIGWLARSQLPTNIGKPGLPASRDREIAVMGVSIGGHAKAYPLQALLGVEVLNDDVGGRPIVVTF
jgi:hypothetical protein